MTASSRSRRTLRVRGWRDLIWLSWRLWRLRDGRTVEVEVDKDALARIEELFKRAGR